MENQEMKEHEEMCAEWEKKHKRGRAFAGVLIVIIGSLFLARELGADLPRWLFSWKMLLIGIGLIIGVKHRFQNFAWIVLVLIGGSFLVSDIYPTLVIKPLLWPILIIAAGLFLIFKPRKARRWKHRDWENYHKYQHYKKEKYNKASIAASNEDLINITAVFGAVQKHIVTKDFKGGEVVTVFGGAELNLSQADFTGKIKLEITQVFGGTRLIIPADWQIKSEHLVSVLGSIEDKRTVIPQTVTPQNEDSTKVLVLEGTIIFGGIEIKSY